MSTDFEYVAEVAERLGLPVVTVCRMVSDLCESYGPDRIVAEPGSMRRTALTVFAVQSVEQLALALTAGAR